MLRRMLLMLGAVIVVVLILAALKFNAIYTQIQQFTAPKPPISVEVAESRQQPWQSRLPAIGTLKASQGIDLSVEIAGTIEDVQFQSGEKVRKGQPIILLDSEVEQARGSGFQPARLGPRVLRTETAPVVALSIVQQLWGDFPA